MKKNSGSFEQTLHGQLISAAIRAPSGDNCQPWSFRIDKHGHIFIDILPERAKSFFDFQHRGTFLSVGAVVENIRTLAVSEGFALKVIYSGGRMPGQEATALYLRPDPGVKKTDSRIVDAILKRTVNRRPFLPIKLPEHKITKILADPIKGTEVRIFDNRHDIARWARLIYLADRIRFSHAQIHREVFSKILFTDNSENTQRLGLEVDRLGLGPMAEPILRYLRPWERMSKACNNWGIDRLFAGQSRFLALASSGIVLVSIPEDSEGDWIRAGEQVERLWLHAQEQGLCVHPMPVSLYLHLRYKKEGTKDFLSKHHCMLKVIDREIADLLGNNVVGAMIFRIGYGWPMRDTAVRLPLNEFIAQNDL